MTNTRRLASMFVVASTIGVAAWAAGPFEVRRSLVSASVDGPSDVAVVTAAPFDESVVRSHDASNYFYAVFDASGAQLDISVQALAGSGVIRLSFDDSNPGSAPVGASTSTVAVAPATIVANGVELATITIVPRDADGQLLGRGLVVSVDPGLLWPAALSGPVHDVGDGTYLAEATALVPGTGSVQVTVETVVLTSSPTVDATAGDPGSLRDLALLQLRDLTSPGGRLDAAHLRPARNRALEALRTLGSTHPARDDNALKTDLDGALRELAALGTAEAAALVDDLLEIARMIAVWNVDQAHLACGSCPKGDAALAEADAMRADGADATDVVDLYARAVEMAIQDVHRCR